MENKHWKNFICFILYGMKMKLYYCHQAYKKANWWEENQSQQVRVGLSLYASK